MPRQGTSNEYHNIINLCLCGKIGKIAILTVNKLATSGAMYLDKYLSYLSMKTFFKRNASMELSIISAEGGNIYHSSVLANSVEQLGDIFLMFPRNQDLTFHANCLHWWRSTCNVKFCFLGKKKNITKTCLHNFDPLKPHFYIVKLGFTGVYIIFLISAQKHRLWVLIRTASRRF